MSGEGGKATDTSTEDPKQNVSNDESDCEERKNEHALETWDTCATENKPLNKKSSNVETNPLTITESCQLCEKISDLLGSDTRLERDLKKILRHERNTLLLKSDQYKSEQNKKLCGKCSKIVNDYETHGFYPHRIESIDSSSSCESASDSEGCLCPAPSKDNCDIQECCDSKSVLCVSLAPSSNTPSASELVGNETKLVSFRELDETRCFLEPSASEDED